jgi:hypothetical protein
MKKILGDTLWLRIERFVGDPPAEQQIFLHHDTLDQIRTATENTQIRSLILTLCWEHGFDKSFLANIENLLQEIKTQFPHVEIFMILNSWFRPVLSAQFAKNKNIKEVLYLDFFMLRVWYYLAIKLISSIAPSWKSSNEKILFLTGKPSRIHRIRLLYKILQTDLRHILEWSFTIPDEIELQDCRKLLEDISDNEFSDLINKQKSPDGNKIIGTGIPYDDNLYDSSLFQIISETNFDRSYFDTPWITEKTWLSIINRRPFIVAGNFYTLDCLENMGFNTFREFLLVPNYDNPDLAEFLEYGSLAKRCGTTVTQLQKKQWKIFYSEMKDPAWPEDLSFDDANNSSEATLIDLMQHYVPPIESISDIRLDAIVENALFWKENLRQYQVEIARQVEENHLKLMSLAGENFTNLNRFVKKHEICFDIDIFFE